jgi:nucleoside-diphosphate-sugar epimerase
MGIPGPRRRPRMRGSFERSAGLPRLLVTGASGFVGRHLLETIKEHYTIYGIARRSQIVSTAPIHPNIRWFETDITDRPALEETFAAIERDGGVDAVVHLAAHYDFTGEEHEQYWRTNVDGLKNVLELSRALRPGHFLFSSSVAACRLPPAGRTLSEDSPADGEHVYARTKRIGEQMVREFSGAFTPIILRFAALFSDWCEYPPLFMFLDTWLSNAWNHRILGGKGVSAIPYLHVQDVVMFLTTVLRKASQIAPGEVLIASPDGCTSHLELFGEATLLNYGHRLKPILMPKPLCWPGMVARDVLGRVLGERPFERPWMARYIDTRMAIDASRTRARLGWAPRPRLDILRRMPFLIENLRTDPVEWNRRNRAAMKQVRVLTNLRIHQLLVRHETEIMEQFTDVLMGPTGAERFPSYQKLSEDEHQWNHRVILRHLLNAVRTRDKGVFVSYCRDLAERRFHEGYRASEVCDALEELNRICFKVLRRDPESNGLRSELLDHITMTLRFGCDQAQESFDQLGASRMGERPRDLSM